jgi:hypothetical protein
VVSNSSSSSGSSGSSKSGSNSRKQKVAGSTKNKYNKTNTVKKQTVSKPNAGSKPGTIQDLKSTIAQERAGGVNGYHWLTTVNKGKVVLNRAAINTVLRHNGCKGAIEQYGIK